MSDIIRRADAIEMAVDVETPQGTYERAIYVDDLMALPSAETHEKRTETHGVRSDLISRADAIEAVCGACCDDGKKYEKCTIYRRGLCADLEALEALPSADAEPTVIRAKTFMRKEDFDMLAEDIKRQWENVICIPCDAEVVSADAVPQLRQTDTLIIADALRYLAEDTERHELDRARAEKLREQILQYGASMCHSADALQNLAKPNKALKGSDLISRQAAVKAINKLPLDGIAVNVRGRMRSLAFVLIEDIMTLPSADRPTGEWKDLEVCSVCGKQSYDFVDDIMGLEYQPNFCPHCGAKMLTKESTENLNLKADGEGVSKGGVSNGDTERHDSCSR